MHRLLNRFWLLVRWHKKILLPLFKRSLLIDKEGDRLVDRKGLTTNDSYKKRETKAILRVKMPFCKNKERDLTHPLKRIMESI